jgi:hypothetical protein
VGPLRSKEQVFDHWSGWVFQSRFRRRAIIKGWRALLRVQRATLADAVLVVKRRDGRVLAFRAPGEVMLPRMALDGWQPIGTQVEGWLDQLSKASNLQLRAVDGTPGREGVTFLYSADADASPSKDDYMWLDAELDISAVSDRDRRLLLISQRYCRTSADET